MTTSELKQKIEKGDYITLSKMLGITPECARMRFRREKQEAIEGMMKIVVSRESLILSANQ